MKILLISDIHWGFSHNTARIWTKYVRKIADFDVLVIAGDLASHRPEQFARGLRFFRAFAGDKPILMVRGNHDLWGGSRGLEDEHDAALLASGVRSLDDSRIGASLASTLLFCNPDESPCAVDRISLSGSTVAMGSKRGPVVVDDVLFCGFDGWYAKEPTTNDSMRINYQTLGFSSFAEFSQYLNRRADNQLYRAIDANFTVKDAGLARQSVLVTHLPIAPGFGNPDHCANINMIRGVAGRFDCLTTGHIHTVKVDGALIQGTRLYAAGGDYDRPSHLIFEV